MNPSNIIHGFFPSLWAVLAAYPGLGLLILLLAFIQVASLFFSLNAYARKQKRVFFGYIMLLLCELAIMVCCIYIGVLGVIGQ